MAIMPFYDARSTREGLKCETIHPDPIIPIQLLHHVVWSGSLFDPLATSLHWPCQVYWVDLYLYLCAGTLPAKQFVEIQTVQLRRCAQDLRRQFVLRLLVFIPCVYI